MSVIDSHLHIWDQGRGRYPWLDEEPLLDHPFLPADVERGSSNVTGYVFVEASAADGLAEARWVESLAGSWPELRGIVAAAALERGRAVRAELDELVRLPHVVGIRRLLQGEGPEFFQRPELVDGLREVARAGLSFDACVHHHQLPALIALLRQVPVLTVVLDHLGKPPVDTGDLDGWRVDLDDLARLPGVVVKLSGVAPESRADSPLAPQAEPVLRAALDAFGADRCMVGSDWPVSAVTANAVSYDDWFALVLDVVAGAGMSVEDVASATATRVYGLGV